MNKNTLSEDGVRYMYNTGSNITLTNNKKNVIINILLINIA